MKGLRNERQGFDARPDVPLRDLREFLYRPHFWGCGTSSVGWPQGGPLAMKSTTRVESLLHFLSEDVVQHLADRGLDTDTCVGTTRVACLALAEVGIKASPLPVRLTGFSERYARALGTGELDPVDPNAAGPDVHARLLSEGAWVVDVDAPPPGMVAKPPSNGRRGWSGHLVALVERRWVLDMTIQQISRPSKGMIFQPFFFRATPKFMAGDPVVFGFGESLARYVRTNDNTFVVAPDWTGVRRDHYLVKDVSAMLRTRAG